MEAAKALLLHCPLYKTTQNIQVETISLSTYNISLVPTYMMSSTVSLDMSIHWLVTCDVQRDQWSLICPETSRFKLSSVFIRCANTVCPSVSNCLPLRLSMRHQSHSATCVSPPQSLLHPQNAINVQPSFILIHSPLAQMKWIRNLVGQGRACRLPSVAELFSILLA